MLYIVCKNVEIGNIYENDHDYENFTININNVIKEEQNNLYYMAILSFLFFLSFSGFIHYVFCYFSNIPNSGIAMLLQILILIFSLFNIFKKGSEFIEVFNLYFLSYILMLISIFVQFILIIKLYFLNRDINVKNKFIYPMIFNIVLNFINFIIFCLFYNFPIKIYATTILIVNLIAWYFINIIVNITFNKSINQSNMIKYN